jgi:hypothetical protein
MVVTIVVAISEMVAPVIVEVSEDTEEVMMIIYVAGIRLVSRATTGSVRRTAE